MGKKPRIPVILERMAMRKHAGVLEIFYILMEVAAIGLGYMHIFIHIKINAAVYLRCVYFTM